MEERLQKILARAGVCSRRGAEELIRQGKVTVDGQVVTEMGVRVDPALHRIVCDGAPVLSEEEKVYLLLNKPTGYLSTLSDPQGRPIVTDLLGGVSARVFPVGRLDYDTEGALLLTNDGEFSQQVLHPSFEVNKTYVATVSGNPSRQKLAELEAGIILEGRRTWPARIRVLTAGARRSTIEIIIHEGRKRQVRKMFAAIGHRVQALERVAYGGLSLGDLPRGRYRYLDRKDLDRIFSGKNPLYRG
ncbi:MAG: rRNA pseudouridine synthase [Desulfobulbaceae bacterium]|nr:rRNA pseudouridine synthase [Desulfobulbaceae bacterium]